MTHIIIIFALKINRKYQFMPSLRTKDFCLEIAAFIIRIYTKEDALIYVPEGYIPFITETKSEPDVEVEVIQNLPFNPGEGTEVFNACEPIDDNQPNNGISLWNIVKHNNQKFLFTSEPSRNIYPYLAADFSQSHKCWTIYNSEIVKENGIDLLNPLAYPMGPLLLYHLALNNNAIMIHASGVQVEEGGYIFSGFSGVGKSTMAGIWFNEGYSVINDDRLLIRKLDGKYHFFNTPMTYGDQPKRALLKAAFLLKHHHENVLTLIKGLKGITKLMAFCIQHHYEPEHVRMIMDTVIDIAQNIDIYELEFVPDERVVQLIKNFRKT